MPTQQEDGPPYVSVACTETCGPLRVSLSRLVLYVSEQYPEANHYTFTCPDCATLCSRPARDAIVALLVASGVTWRPFVPGNLLETKPETDTPFEEDDVIELGLWLDHYNETGELEIATDG